MPAPVQIDDFGFNQGETPSPRHYHFLNGTGGDFDLSGYTLASEVRESASSLTVIATATLAFEGPASQGKVEMSFLAAQSANMYGTCVYDVWATHPTLGSLPLVTGTITVRARITAAAA
jgi:hypothetical protein